MSIVYPYFQKSASSYDAATPIQSQVASTLATHIQSHTNPVPSDQADNVSNLPKQVWLDIGCGTGKLTQAVFATWPDPYFSCIEQLYGIDASSAMLETWEQQGQSWLNHAAKSITMTPILADMQRLALDTKSIDYIISSFAVHWAKPDVIASFAKLLKSGGQLHLAIPVAGSFSVVQQRFPQLPIFPFLPSEKWITAMDALCQAQQGKILYCYEQSFRHTYVNIKTLLAELKKMGGAVSGQAPLPVAIWRQYLQDRQPIDLDYQVLLIGARLA